MAVVKGVKEKVHLPLYDAVLVPPGQQLRGKLTSSVLRFFVDVHGKTKLETNMQSASLLPHWNTFEARALRVVVSDLPPVFSREVDACLTEARNGDPPAGEPPDDNDGKPSNWRHKTPWIEERLAAALELVERLDNARADMLDVLERTTLDSARTEAMTYLQDALLSTEAVDAATLREELAAAPADAGTHRRRGPGPGRHDRPSPEEIAQRLEACLGDPSAMPPPSQLDGCRAPLLATLIYGSVTSLVVGEKVMIQMPTWFFPAGGGPYSEDGRQVTHGFPSPEATFRFAEPIVIDTQQNFRVEIEIPEHRVLGELQRLYGPLGLWVVLDGYMTRDVQ